MGLDCFPIPCPCGKHGTNPDIERGLTHLPDAPCPFIGDELPKGFFGTCCWLRGKVAARELDALGLTDLANELYADMTAEEAIPFAQKLRNAADELERQHASDDPKPKGAGWNGTWNEKKKQTVWRKYSTFEEAIARVRDAAVWYEKVGRLGFGVHAWY